jgi:hypothetical protein
MLIINESGAALAPVLDSAFAANCREVVIRITAYRNRFSNSFIARFDLQQSYPPTLHGNAVLLLCRNPPTL